MKAAKRKTRAPILAAGGIVVRHDGKPRLAVVQLRKMSAWVLPKGKLTVGESAIAAARREVLEETGHRVSIHDFLGTLAYETGGRPKIVHFWRMQALGGPVGPLMRDVKAVEWLTLEAAMARLTHAREKAFLEQVGPAAMRRAVRPQRKSVLPRPRHVPAPQLVPVSEPLDFAAPLPADDLAHVARGPRRASDQSPIEKTLIEKTWDWLRQTTRQAQASRD
ncbi:MAG TPA: NUDIX hydrolase [Xanthobacteraceae bacterium]|nr:NUDIX hydrolase [Xanthobacteraceae bacterium]